MSTFISYSRDDDTHIAWVHTLSTRLIKDGIPTTIDKGAVVPPEHLREVMEAAVLAHTYVVVICTPKYRARSERGTGGAAYMGDVIPPSMKTSGNQRKFIPVLRKGDWNDSGPLWLSEHYIDLREGPGYEARYQDLLATLQGVKGRMSRHNPAPVVAAPPPRHATAAEAAVEPVKIIGVIMEEVGAPRNDGTAMSRWHRVPLKLSRQVDRKWEIAFERAWNTSTRFANVRRTSIAKVNGDRINMSCTTIDEVLNDHKMDLIQCVLETNRIMAEKEAADQAEAEAFRLRLEEHKKHLAEVAERARFE